MGYSVEAGIYTAQEAGAPHERARLYILAMDYTYSNGFQRERECSTNANEQKSLQQRQNPLDKYCKPSYELGNANSNGNQKRNGFGGSKEEAGRNKIEENKRQWVRAEFIPADKTMANTNYTGFGEFRRSEPVRKKQLSIECGSFKTWPAGQGKFQYEWEAPRAVEPGLGCTINGYNFRNDLLRMYGNGVVEQTAEIAFRDLLKKFNNPLIRFYPIK
jgi:DNA (cytosine-5)-methyltransferase 1